MSVNKERIRDGKYLLERGWLKKEPEHATDKYIYYRPGDEKRKYYGKCLDDALVICDRTDAINESGIHWMMDKQRRDFGWRVLFLLKGETNYRMYSIWKSEEGAKTALKYCKDNLQDGTLFNSAIPFEWTDNSGVEKVLVYHTDYGDYRYLITSYTDYIKLAFRFMERYLNHFDDEGDFEEPEKPSYELDSVPKEFYKEAERQWENYKKQLVDQEQQNQDRVFLEKAVKGWETKNDWYHYHMGVSNMFWDKYNSHQKTMELEEFNDPKYISEL